jgi:tellurite resistance protein TerC
MFAGLVVALLALDLGAFHRKPRVVRLKEALLWSGVWIAAALLFSIFVYVGYQYHWMGLGTAVDGVDGAVNTGGTAATKFLTGYVLEKSLSVDNIFVMAVIFASLKIPAIHQHRVLFWGILGAVVLRAAMIGLGAELIQHYHWVLYFFGVFLVLTAAKMLFWRSMEGDPANSGIVKLARRFLPVTTELSGERFMTKVNGRWMLTPLALAMVVVESSDVVFAVDSVPAIFGVTADPFLVFTSNVFAILSLRCLYFALAGFMALFQYLKPSLAVVMAVIGGKMLAGHWLSDAVGPSFNLWLLGLVLLILAGGVIASLARKNSPAAIRERAMEGATQWHG